MPFFGATPAEPPTFVLELATHRTFRLRERFRYLDSRIGDVFIVPRDLAGFRTDLASVPRFASFLVPTVGQNLPASLLHDALVSEGSSELDYIGPEVTRTQADLIFRDALTELGVPVIRRWLMWSAVSMMTIWRKGASWRGRLAFAVVAFVALAVIQALDLIGAAGVDLPWMVDRLAIDVPAAFVGQFVAAILLALLFQDHFRAVAVFGSLVLLLVIPASAAAIGYAVYSLFERLAVTFAGAGRPVGLPDTYEDLGRREAPVPAEIPPAADSEPPTSMRGHKIFLSYASEDRTTAADVARRLEQETGADVWWDPQIQIGEIWEEKIEEALTAAVCVVVLWSEHSIKSRWVRLEAGDADRKGKLVPAAIEDVEAPLRFRAMQHARLFEDKDGDEWQRLVDRVGTLLAQRPEQAA